MSANLQDVATEIHYPGCWDTEEYPTLADALMCVIREVGGEFITSLVHAAAMAEAAAASTTEEQESAPPQ